MRHRIAAAVLALATVGPAVAKPTQPPPPPTSTAAPAAKAGTYDWASAFERLGRNDWQGVGDEAEAVLADPARAADHAAAWGMLGAALIKGGIPYGGLMASLEGVKRAAGPNAPFYRDVLITVDQLDEAAYAGEILGADFGVPLDDATRSHLAWVAARSHFADGSWGAVLGLLPLVSSSAPYALDARLLQAVTLVQQSRYEDALQPLLDLQSAAVGRDAHFRDVIDLDLARTFYATGNYGRAMEFYGKVARSDAAWPESVFERAWAHYRIDDIQGTLGLLMTSTSPFFRDQYLPEAELLKAQSLYLMCKFPDTKQAIDDFQAHYKPTLEQLRAATNKLDAPAAWADYLAMKEGRTTQLPTSMLKRFEGDERLARAVVAIAVGREDLVSFDRLRGHAFADRVKPLLAARLDARVAEQGSRVLTFATDQVGDLNDMLTGIELTRIDLLSEEARLYDRAAATSTPIETPEERKQLRKDAKKKGKRMWPFEGEFWADELGWYRVTARPDCPASATGVE